MFTFCSCTVPASVKEEYKTVYGSALPASMSAEACRSLRVLRVGALAGIVAGSAAVLLCICFGALSPGACLGLAKYTAIFC
jgi:hypothetical protein